MSDRTFDQEVDLQKRGFSHSGSLARWGRQGTTFAALATAFVGAGAGIAAYSKAVEVPEVAYYPFALLISFSLSCSFLHDEFVCWKTELDCLKNFGLSHYPEGADRFKEVKKGTNFVRPTIPGLIALGRCSIFFWPLLSYIWPDTTWFRGLLSFGYLVLVVCFTVVTVVPNVACERLRKQTLAGVPWRHFPDT